MCVRSEMRGQDLSPRERIKIITYRCDFHYSQREIARRLKCSQSTVSYILKQHLRHKDSPQYHLRGRKKKLSSSQQNHLKNIIRENNNLISEEI